MLSVLIAGALVLPHGTMDVTLTFRAQSTNPDVQSLLSFQNIEMWDLDFSGVPERHYEIRVKRFVKGKKTIDKVAFDSKELGDTGKPVGGLLSFRVLSQAKDRQAKLDFQFPRWSAAQKFPCLETRYDYVMKNFLGSEDKMSFSAQKETYVLAYLQPHARPDGSSSYCEVAQSGIDPEKLWDRYQVPCYFLVSVRFQR